MFARCPSEHWHAHDGPTFTSTTGYDASSRVTSQQYPTGLTVAYSYTALGYLERLTNASAGNALLWQAQTANAWGKVETEVVGNGIQTRRVFDGLTGRIAEIDVGPNGGGSGPTSTNVLRHRYAYDSLSNLTSRIDDNGSGNGQAVSELFAYDPINRLSQYQVAAPAITNLNRTVDLQYNALGNLLFKTDVGVYSYGAQGASSVRPHAVAAVNGVNYTYDANGNMTVASGGKFSAISYTSFNLPDGQSGAVGPISSPRYTWQYDADHQRIREDHSDSLGTRTTWYLHPDNVGSLGYEFEVAANGTRTNRHYLTAGGSVGVLITNGEYTSGSAQSVVKTEYWHKDHLGSIAATTDVYGSVTNRYAYDPFGKRRSTDGNYDGYGTIVADYPNQTDRGFTGHEQLDDIGIVHMNGRLYDANAGRFLQADPFIQAQGNLQSYNRYAYVMNNPLNAVDPSGYFSWKSVFKVFHEGNPFDPRSFNKFLANAPGQKQLDHFILNHQWAYAIGEIAVTAATFYCWGCGNILYTSYYSYERTGSFNAAARAAAISAAGDALGYYTGSGSDSAWYVKGAISGVGTGVLATASGGSFTRGFFSGFFSSALKSGLDEIVRSDHPGNYESSLATATDDAVYKPTVDQAAMATSDPNSIEAIAMRDADCGRLGAVCGFSHATAGTSLSTNEAQLIGTVARGGGLASEASPILSGLAKNVPGFQAFSITHDIAMGYIEVSMGTGSSLFSLVNKITILPFATAQYVGFGAQSRIYLDSLVWKKNEK